MRSPQPRFVLGALAFLVALVFSACLSPATSPARVVTTVTKPSLTALAFVKADDERFQDAVVDVARWEAAAALPAPTTTTTALPPATTAPPPSPPASPPAPEPASVEVPAEGSAADAVQQYFGDIFAKAWDVSGCESGHDPSQISPGGGNWGLFQINTVHADNFAAVTGKPFYDGALDPYANAQYARHLYDSEGWGPWTCRNA